MMAQSKRLADVVGASPCTRTQKSGKGRELTGVPSPPRSFLQYEPPRGPPRPPSFPRSESPPHPCSFLQSKQPGGPPPPPSFSQSNSLIGQPPSFLRSKPSGGPPPPPSSESTRGPPLPRSFLQYEPPGGPQPPPSSPQSKPPRGPTPPPSSSQSKPPTVLPPPPSSLQSKPPSVSPPPPSSFQSKPPTVLPPPPSSPQSKPPTVSPPPPSFFQSKPPTVLPPPPSSFQSKPPTVLPPPPSSFQSKPPTVSPPPPSSLQSKPHRGPPPPPSSFQSKPPTVSPPPPSSLQSKPPTVSPPPPSSLQSKPHRGPPPPPSFPRSESPPPPCLFLPSKQPGGPPPPPSLSQTNSLIGPPPSFPRSKPSGGPPPPPSSELTRGPPLPRLFLQYEPPGGPPPPPSFPQSKPPSVSPPPPSSLQSKPPTVSPPPPSSLQSKPHRGPPPPPSSPRSEPPRGPTPPSSFPRSESPPPPCSFLQSKQPGGPPPPPSFSQSNSLIGPPPSFPQSKPSGGPPPPPLSTEGPPLPRLFLQYEPPGGPPPPPSFSQSKPPRGPTPPPRSLQSKPPTVSPPPPSSLQSKPPTISPPPPSSPRSKPLRAPAPPLSFPQSEPARGPPPPPSSPHSEPPRGPPPPPSFPQSESPLPPCSFLQSELPGGPPPPPLLPESEPPRGPPPPLSFPRSESSGGPPRPPSFPRSESPGGPPRPPSFPQSEPPNVHSQPEQFRVTTGDHPNSQSPKSVVRPLLTATDVTCTLCLSHLKDPKLLPCLHSFCKTCLEGLIHKTKTEGKIACPQCRCMHSVTHSDAEGFPSDLVILNTLAFREDFQKPKAEGTKPILCNMCVEGDAATNHCPACNNFLCEFCSKAHERQLNYRTHTLVPLDKADAEALKAFERPQYCVKHKGEVFKLYCNTCQQLICRDCAIVNHREHSFGFTSQLRPQVEQEIREMARGITVKRNVFQDHLAFIKAVETRRTEHSSGLVKEINAAFDSLSKLVEQERKKLLEQEENANTADLKRVWEHKEFIEVTLAGIASGLRYVDRLCSCANDQDMLAMSSMVRQQLSALQQKSWSIEPSSQYFNLLTFSGISAQQQEVESIQPLQSMKPSNFTTSVAIVRPSPGSSCSKTTVNLGLSEAASFEMKVVNKPHYKVDDLFVPSVSVVDTCSNRAITYFHTLSYKHKRNLWLLAVTPTYPGSFTVSMDPNEDGSTISSQSAPVAGYYYDEWGRQGRYKQQDAYSTAAKPNTYVIRVTGDLKPGDRVRRGPNWRGGEEDGGEGSEGVVIPPVADRGLEDSHYGSEQVHVRWPNGKTVQYTWNRQQHTFPIELIPIYLLTT